MISARITNLAEFMKDTTQAKSEVDAGLTRGLQSANDALLPLAAAKAPRLSGELAGSGSSEVQGTSAALMFSAEHAPILEWFERGRFSNLSAKYGPPPRFAARTLLDHEEQIVDAIELELEEAVTADGWFT